MTNKKSISMNLELAFKVSMAKRGTNQSKLAAEMDCTKAYINSVIKGSSGISASKLDEIANSLGYKLWQFIKNGDES